MAARIKALDQRGFDTDELFMDDTYECWTVNRPAGWADGAAVEAQRRTVSGLGRLSANGAGGPQAGELVIHVESPYRFQVHATAPIESGNLLVINGTRLFRVDVVKRGDIKARFMDVYLTELFSTPMPEEAP